MTATHIAALLGLSASFLLAFVRVRMSQVRRERGLEAAVRQRTEELELERSRERCRNRVLEMLAANQSLGNVLDSICSLIQQELPEARAAVLLKRHEGWNVASAPGIAAEWVRALSVSHSVPFEVWKKPADFPSPAQNPAWHSFFSRLGENVPAHICSAPAGNPELPVGALLVFNSSRARGHSVLTSASRLAQLAIEHSRFYEELNFQAHHDSLTGLANRSLFTERLGRSIHEAENRNGKVGLLFIDLDHFKEINDRLSHRAGDLLLTEMADRMRRTVRPGDTVARIGGDEFNILLANINSLEEAEDVAERILKCMREPFTVQGVTMAVSGSVGIAMFPDDGSDPDQLQRDADAAMYCAKNLGRNRIQAFGSRNETLDRVRMEQDLRQALKDGSFEVYYQPKVAADGHFGGLEALLRLNHPVHGQISPATFIPVAEESGLIVQLGAWVLDEVCRQIAEWQSIGLGQVCVAVNVSPLQLTRPDFSSTVRETLNRYGIAPWNLELELTESLLMRGGEESQVQMRELRGLGIRFSLDDFGTGYSSLSYLHRLPVDCIKLDRSFVQCIDSDSNARRLVQAMIGVAQGLGLSVVAEGVETEEQRSVLIAAGCPMMQGYLFARPKPASQVTDLLREGTSDLDHLSHALRVSAIPVAV